MKKITLAEVRAQLRRSASPAKAQVLQSFFKTGPGEYGEGDVFIGVQIPPLRALAVKAKDLELPDLSRLLHSEIHEERMLACILLVNRFRTATGPERARIYRFYVRHFPRINSWDLVDCSAAPIVGGYLEHRSRAPLYKWARSKSLWVRRIAIIATFHFIKRDDHRDTLAIAERLLNDDHDLIHKAVGWMLREVGKRDLYTETKFLARHAHEMPRTTLRYAIERMTPAERRRFMTQTSSRS